MRQQEAEQEAPEQPTSAFVEDGRQPDDDDSRPTNNEGPKIKMNRIGKRSKKGAAAAKDDRPHVKKSAAPDYMAQSDSKISSGGLTE